MEKKAFVHGLTPIRPSAIGWWGTLIIATLIGLFVAERDHQAIHRDFVVYSASVNGCAIIIPSTPTEYERNAARILSSSLAKASRRSQALFPIIEERTGIPRNSIYVGATRRGQSLLCRKRKPPFDIAVGFAVHAGAVFVKAERRESCESAVSWFMEKKLGVQFFMPGPLGEHVPHRSELILAAGLEIHEPGFIHRNLGLGGGPEALSWHFLNRLETRFEYGENMANIFRPDDFQREPEMTPMRNGQRFFPHGTSANWQPNLLSPTAVRHAANVAIRAFDQSPTRLSFSVSINDTDRYDESEETLAAVSPPRFFRHRPDYSDLVFGFSNKVAKLVAQRHPDRWISALAYYWCENTPRFPVERNVIPFLTADRSQWSHQDFASEDQGLIKRWCNSGAEIVGVYDYFQGEPFLVPRPTLYAIKESIPYHYRSGVRAFYAEMYSNWALDGPKAWLAAKLLWSPERSSDQLLELYFREFWCEAAVPMRAFFEVAERTWLGQPGPPLWLRFYKDDDQAWIYGPASRRELRMQLNLAIRLATTDIVKARVAFVEAGLSVSEAYWRFAASREVCSRLARDSAETYLLIEAWKEYRSARAEFVWRFGHVRREHPLALAPQDLEIYLRNQPDSRVARELSRSESGRAFLQDESYLPWVHLGATGREIAHVMDHGVESLLDPEWLYIAPKPVGSSATSDWTEPGLAWVGSGEPWEGRTVELCSRADGKRVLRIASCRTEGIGQWVSVVPNALYAATVRVCAKTSPGTATFLIVSFLDENGRHLDLGRVDRLPPDAAVQDTTLCVIAKTPATARRIGFAVRVLNQINDDFAEFWDASLRRLDP